MQRMLKTTEVTLPTDTEVRVARSFAAPRELVYEAYTTPALMQRWLVGMPGWKMPVCDMDVRVGGEFRWRWRSEEDGTEFGFQGEFLDVAPPERLRHTQHFDPGDLGGSMGDGPALITVTFEEG